MAQHHDKEFIQDKAKWKDSERSAEDKTKATYCSCGFNPSQFGVFLLFRPWFCWSCSRELHLVPCVTRLYPLTLWRCHQPVRNMQQTTQKMCFSAIFSLKAGMFNMVSLSPTPPEYQLCGSIFSMFSVIIHIFDSGLYLILCESRTNGTLVSTKERYKPVKTEAIRHRTNQDKCLRKEYSSVVNMVHGNNQMPSVEGQLSS